MPALIPGIAGNLCVLGKIGQGKVKCLAIGFRDQIDDASAYNRFLFFVEPGDLRLRIWLAACP